MVASMEGARAVRRVAARVASLAGYLVCGLVVQMAAVTAF